MPGSVGRAGHWLASGWLASNRLGRIADVAGILGLVLSVIVLINRGGAPLILLAVYLVVLNVLLLAGLVIQQAYNQHQTGLLTRRARLADASPTLRLVLQHQASATAALMDDNEDSFMSHTTSALSALAEMFRVLTGGQCRVTLKEVFRPDERQGDLAVQTLCRSESADLSSSDAAARPHDWVSDNTDFNSLVTSSKLSFFSNDLVALMKEGRYRNSHWTEDVILRGDFAYRATIVWPVRGRRAVGAAEALAGFLCVDTQDVGVFDEVTDIPLGSSVAPGFYASLTRYSEEKTSAVLADDQPGSDT